MSEDVQLQRAGDRTGKPQISKRVRSNRPVAPNWFRLGYLIHDVSRMRRTLFDQHMKPKGITRSQWWVLANLSRHGADGIMSVDLAKLMDVGKVTLGGLIERLEKAGYVYRRADKQDKRAKQIFITEAGYQLIDIMRIITEDLNQRICEGLSADEIENVEGRLIHIKNNLREMLTEDGIDADGLKVSAVPAPPCASDA